MGFGLAEPESLSWPGREAVDSVLLKVNPSSAGVRRKGGKQALEGRNVRTVVKGEWRWRWLYVCESRES